MNPEYLTKDLNLAVVLKLSGIPLVRVDNYAGKGVFVFLLSPKIQETITSYFNDEVVMNPRTVFDCWKGLKSQVYTTTNNIR